MCIWKQTLFSAKWVTLLGCFMRKGSVCGSYRAKWMFRRLVIITEHVSELIQMPMSSAAGCTLAWTLFFLCQRWCGEGEIKEAQLQCWEHESPFTRATSQAERTTNVLAITKRLDRKSQSQTVFSTQSSDLRQYHTGLVKRRHKTEGREFRLFPADPTHFWSPSLNPTSISFHYDWSRWRLQSQNQRLAC